MKNNFIRYFFMMSLPVILFRCGVPQYVTAPSGTVPLRNKLETDVFGGYITLTTRDLVKTSGELIGIRNDSVFVFGQSIRGVPRDSVKDARIIVHMPNNYKGFGLGLMGLSSLVIVHAGEYGGGPVVMGIGGILYNGIGLASAQGTEDKKINYYDWSEGWEKVMLYARFPQGIPAALNLVELRSRQN